MSRNKFVPLSMTWREKGEWKSLPAKNGGGSAKQPMTVREYEAIADKVDLVDKVDGGPGDFHIYYAGREHYLSDRIAEELRAETFTLYKHSDRGDLPFERSFSDRIAVVPDPPPAEVHRTHVLPRTALEVRLSAELDQLRAEQAELRAQFATKPRKTRTE